MKTSSSSNISSSSSIIMAASSTVLLKLLRTGVVLIGLRVVVEVVARFSFSLDLRLFGWEDFSVRQLLFCWRPREFEGRGGARKEMVGAGRELLAILSL